VLAKEQPIVMRSHTLGDRFNSIADIYLSVISKEDRSKNVLIMLEPTGAPDGGKERRKNNRGSRGR
jgi:hypothetical protein